MPIFDFTRRFGLTPQDVPQPDASGRAVVTLVDHPDHRDKLIVVKQADCTAIYADNARLRLHAPRSGFKPGLGRLLARIPVVDYYNDRELAEAVAAGADIPNQVLRKHLEWLTVDPRSF